LLLLLLLLVVLGCSSYVAQAAIPQQHMGLNQQLSQGGLI
jgi:hypothetical protein